MMLVLVPFVDTHSTFLLVIFFKKKKKEKKSCNRTLHLKKYVRTCFYVCDLLFLEYNLIKVRINKRRNYGTSTVPYQTIDRTNVRTYV